MNVASEEKRPNSSSRRSARVQLLILACFALVALSSCDHASTSRRGILSREVPGSRLGAHGTIPWFDAYIDSARTLHVLWDELETTTSSSNGLAFKHVVWYQRGLNLGAQWSAPIRILSDEPLRAELVDCAGTLHILAGFGLRDFVSSDHGATWHEASPILPNVDEHRMYAQKFAVAPRDSILLVAFTAAHPGSAVIGSRLSDSTDIWFVGSTGTRNESPSKIGQVRGVVQLQTRPQLLVSDTSIAVAIGTCRTRELLGVDHDRSEVTGTWDTGGVEFSRTMDLGAHWQPLQSLPRPRGATSEWDAVTQVELVRVPQALFMLMESSGALHQARVTGGGFTDVSWVREHHVQLMNALDSQAFACEFHGSRGVLAWIAPRTETNRSPLLELVQKWPSELRVAEAGVVGDSIAVGPDERWTEAADEVSAVRILVADGKDLVMWSENRLGPLLLGAPRMGSSIRFAVRDAK